MLRLQSNFVILFLILTSFALAPTEAGRSLKEKVKTTYLEGYSSATTLSEVNPSGLSSMSVKMLSKVIDLKLFAAHVKRDRRLLQDYSVPSPGVGHPKGN